MTFEPDTVKLAVTVDDDELEPEPEPARVIAIYRIPSSSTMTPFCIFERPVV